MNRRNLEIDSKDALSFVELAEQYLTDARCDPDPDRRFEAVMHAWSNAHQAWVACEGHDELQFVGARAEAVMDRTEFYLMAWFAHRLPNRRPPNN